MSLTLEALRSLDEQPPLVSPLPARPVVPPMRAERRHGLWAAVVAIILVLALVSIDRWPRGERMRPVAATFAVTEQRPAASVPIVAPLEPRPVVEVTANTAPPATRIPDPAPVAAAAPVEPEPVAQLATSTARPSTPAPPAEAAPSPAPKSAPPAAVETAVPVAIASVPSKAAVRKPREAKPAPATSASARSEAASEPVVTAPPAASVAANFRYSQPERPVSSIPPTALEQARGLLAQGRGAEAAALLGRIQSRWPREPAPRLLLARWHLGGGDAAAAVAVLSSLQPPLADWPQYYDLWAQALLRQGRSTAAAGLYVRLLGAAPQRASYWLGYGAALEAMADRDRAVQPYRQARQLSPAGSLIGQRARTALAQLLRGARS